MKSVEDAVNVSLIEKHFPGSAAAVRRLNERTNASDPGEYYAAWVVWLEEGVLVLTALQPYYVRGDQKTFIFDDGEFV